LAAEIEIDSKREFEIQMKILDFLKNRNFGVWFKNSKFKPRTFLTKRLKIQSKVLMSKIKLKFFLNDFERIQK
jgi:hypothetical protein